MQSSLSIFRNTINHMITFRSIKIKIIYKINIDEFKLHLHIIEFITK